MTCIIGYVSDDNIVYIGADSAGVSGNDIRIRADEKVFKNGDFIFGFTTSFRMGQILRYVFKPPERKVFSTDDEYLHNDFINEIIKTFQENGYAKIESNVIKGGMFIFGYKGKLYFVDNDFQIGKPIRNYESIGCGENYAIGCLYALENTNISIEKKITKALEAAEEFSTGVRGPFHIIKEGI